jgi:hypothetical protein
LTEREAVVDTRTADGDGPATRPGAAVARPAVWPATERFSRPARLSPRVSPDATDSGPDASSRTVPVDPPVHVETFPSHHGLTWRAGPLADFLTAVTAEPAVEDGHRLLVDATAAAGRRRLAPHEVDTSTGATTYVRADPSAPWTAAWERRTTPVVSLTGAPAAGLTARLHLATTDCDRWATGARELLCRLLDRG